MLQLILQAVHNRADDFKGSIILVHCFYDDPGSIVCIRFLQHLLIHLQITVKVLIPVPVLLRHPPGGLLGPLQLLKTFLLLILVDIQEKLHDDSTVITQLFFKGQNILVRIPKLVLPRKTVKTVHLDTAVPGAVKDSDPALCRRLCPIAPQEGPHLLVLRGAVAGINVKAPGIQGLYEPVNLYSLAGGSHSLKHQNNRNACILTLPLQKPQLLFRLVHDPAVSLLVNFFT